jgi:hypothetical protein
VDLTEEAVNWDQCQIWNRYVAFVEKTSSFVYTAEGFDPVPVANRETVGNGSYRQFYNMVLIGWCW